MGGMGVGQHRDQRRTCSWGGGVMRRLSGRAVRTLLRDVKIRRGGVSIWEEAISNK